MDVIIGCLIIITCCEVVRLFLALYSRIRKEVK